MVLHNGNKKTIVEIVMPIVFDLEEENHRIYFDRFYSSLLLFSNLKQYKIEAIVTVMPNRLKVSNEMKIDIDNLDNDASVLSIDK